MSISSISGASAAHGAFATRKSALQQRSTDFSTLASALGSSNLSSAQNAFAALQKDAQSIPAQASSQVNAQTLQQVKSDAQTLATTLASGNLTGAQKAFQTLRQHSAGAHLRGAHYRFGTPVAGSSGTTGTTAASDELVATQAIGSVGSTLNVSV